MNYCDLAKRGLTFQQFHNHHNSRKKALRLKCWKLVRCVWAGRAGQRGSARKRDRLKAWPSQNCVYDIFSEGQVFGIAQLPLFRHSSSKLGSALALRQFRLSVRWTDCPALDFSVHLTTLNLAALRFASRQRDKKMIVWRSAKLLADTNN